MEACNFVAYLNLNIILILLCIEFCMKCMGFSLLTLHAQIANR